MANELKRWIVGRPVSTGRLGESRLSERIALPVFCSDPISSVASPASAPQHTVSLQGVDCVDRIGTDHLITPASPAAGTVCPA